jgi:tetratricopeptide (TPR) repeat protein
VEFTLSYGRRLGESLSLGGTLKMEQQSLAGYSGSSFRADFGVMGYPGLVLAPEADWSRRLGVGGSVRNLFDSPMRLDQEEVPDPTTVRGGLSYRAPLGLSRSALFALDLETGPNTDTDLHAGVEVRLHPLLALRSGVSDGGFSAGAGLSWKDFGFDYVFEGNSLGNVHRFGLSVGFGATVEESRLAALRAEEDRVSSRLEQAFAAREEERVRELIAKAEAGRAAGQQDEALDVLSAAATLVPDHPEVRRLRVQCLREKAGSLELSGRLAEAAVTYGRIQAIVPEDSLAMENALRCRQESNRRAARSEEVRGLFSAALDAFSSGDLAAARTGFQGILEMEPEDREAEAILRRTEETIDDRVHGLLDRAAQFTRAGFFTEAEAMLDEAQGYDSFPEEVKRAEASLASARKARPAPAAAVSSSTRKAAAHRSPEAAKELETLYKRGIAAAEEGRGDDAMRYWELVASIDPGYQQVRDYLKREYLMRGMDAFAGGRLDDAVAYWQKALVVDPDDEKAKGYLARARQQQSRTREIFGGSGQ